VAKEAL